MKKIIYLIIQLILPLAVLLSCKKDHHELGPLLDPSALRYEVIQDLKADPGGNTVILKNNTPGTLSIWDYQTGTSGRMVDTIHYAFAGEYVVRFSAATAGGVVKADSVVVKVTSDNLKYVNDPLWTALSGGVGKEKQWVLDTEGKFFSGPLSFYGVDNGWLKSGGPWASGSFATGCYGTDCWTWGPGTADIYPNIMASGDYGEMTFSLTGNAGYKAVKPMEKNVTETGTYYLNVAAKTLSITNGTILRGYKPAKDGLKGISNWSLYKVISLDENTLQLGVIRDRDVDGEGQAMLVYNFISKSFSDHYVPPVKGPDEGFDPTFKAGELLTLLTGTGSGRLWKIDAAGNPVDWIAAGKGWTKSHSDSRDWGWNNAWDAAALNSWILFDRVGGMKYTRNQNGSLTSGTFSINEATNEVTLDGDLLIQNPASFMNPSGHVFKIIKAFPGKTESKGIWLGTSYNADKDEWFAFHYIL